MTIRIDDFVDALSRTLRTMAELEPVPSPVEHVREASTFADVSAHLALLNDVEHCVVITVSEAAAIAIVRGIAHVDVQFDDPLVADTVGELLNVIVGSAQKRAGFEFTIPVIAKGKGHLVRVLNGAETQRVRSEVNGGSIDLYLLRRGRDRS